jgi:ABC-2 type transport system ATP-binding protein
MNAIDIKNLSKHYKGFSLENLNLTLPSGCIMGLVGENGAGKSTTIRLILGITGADSGEITVFGQQMSPELKERIGVVLDEPGFPSCMTAGQIGKMLSGLYRSWQSDTFAGYLEKLQIPVDKAFKDFSKGM